MDTDHDYPLERGQEPLIRDMRPWWPPFGEVSPLRKDHIMIRKSESCPFYAPRGYWYRLEHKISIECYIYLFHITIKCNVSQFIPLLIIGNHPSASLKNAEVDSKPLEVTTLLCKCARPSINLFYTNTIPWIKIPVQISNTLDTKLNAQVHMYYTLHHIMLEWQKVKCV